MPNTYLAQVEFATSASGWSPGENVVRVELLLEGKALHLLEDMRAGEQNDWVKFQEALHGLLSAGDQKGACHRLNMSSTLELSRLMLLTFNVNVKRAFNVFYELVPERRSFW